MSEPAASESTYRRTSISLPTGLAEYAARRGGGNTSAYIAQLIAQDQRRENVLRSLERHGYVGEMAVTDEGLARARERLDRAAARRAARNHERRAA
jgi:hypothetical protein